MAKRNLERELKQYFKANIDNRVLSLKEEIVALVAFKAKMFGNGNHKKSAAAPKPKPKPKSKSKPKPPPKVKKRRPMSRKEKNAISARMKQMWADKKKNGGS